MAASTEDSLKTLNRMFNEVLVQTGKQLKSTSKDGPKTAAGASSGIRDKTTAAISSYQYALDDLESEITRAKAVLLRDLEKLRAARASPPVPTPILTPDPQPRVAPAPMAEMPSAAAHTMNAPEFFPPQETKTVAPFPDMGMGMGGGVVDLTASEKKPAQPSPRTAIKPPPRATPPVKSEVKPSPKPAPKATPPAKVTPVPPPQIPRLHPPQPATVGPNTVAQPKAQPSPQPPQVIQPSQPPQEAPAAQPAPVVPLDATLAGPDPGVAGAGGELNFTDMGFALDDSQGAPPAPMPEFDLASFASMENIGGDAAVSSNEAADTLNNPSQPAKEADKTDTNIDDLFNLGPNGVGDDMFDLGGAGANSSAFDDMFYDNQDADMTQFDEEFFS
ncbi:hypothetical protein F5Y15DRAFT_365522 [Xylariaceae sp. FL0016]|nr:hypothetical protein F5Y15DRAFT_365522 [Xylariaceae sp. FL0016]